MDVCIEGGHLSRHQAVFTHAIAVVGAEDEIGVLRLTACCHRGLQVTDHPVDGEHRLRAFEEVPVDCRDVLTWRVVAFC
jgi:hypothetical protein